MEPETKPGMWKIMSRFGLDFGVFQVFHLFILSLFHFVLSISPTRAIKANILNVSCFVQVLYVNQLITVLQSFEMSAIIPILQM